MADSTGPKPRNTNINSGGKDTEVKSDLNRRRFLQNLVASGIIVATPLDVLGALKTIPEIDNPLGFTRKEIGRRFTLTNTDSTEVLPGYVHLTIPTCADFADLFETMS